MNLYKLTRTEQSEPNSDLYQHLNQNDYWLFNNFFEIDIYFKEHYYLKNSVK